MPKPVRAYTGLTVDLGWMYYAYMALLSTFSTNSINILAGVNGLEVAQALVIALSVMVNDLLYIPVWPRIAFREWVLLEGGAILQRGSQEVIQRHLLSLYFMGPLIGVCAGFIFHNWYACLAQSLFIPLTLPDLGTLLERSRETPYVTLQAWPSPSSPFKATIRRRFSSSLYPKSSTSCSAVLSYSDSYRVRDIGSRRESQRPWPEQS